MLVWVVYDITNDKTRNKASKYCLNKGLYRIQKSVFLGEIEKNQKDELKIMMEDLITEENDSVYIFPSDKSILKETDLIGKGFDKELISNAIVSKFI